MKRLSSLSGEFRAKRPEAAFQASRLNETLRQTRNLFLLSAILNTLFLFSDWRFFGTPHFYVAVPARLGVVAISLICLALNNRPRNFTSAQGLMLCWQWVTAPCVALLVSSHSAIALFVVLLLPMIYYLVVPNAYRWTVLSGGGCSILMLIGYFSHDHMQHILFGLAMAVLVLNCALAITVSRANRLARLEWSATRAAQDARRVLARNRDALETIFMSVPVPLLVTSADGKLIKRNEASLAFFGAQAHEQLQGSIADIYVDEDSRTRFLSMLERDGRVDGFESQVRRRDGTIRDILVSSRRTSLEGGYRLVSSVVDITDRKHVEMHLAQLAMSDSLTGLANRSHFMAAAERALRSTGHEAGLAILVLDVDDFKQVNDSAGHASGDALLRAVAARLQVCVRPGDLVARLGGDEFAILLAGVGHPDALDPIVARMMDRLRAPVLHDGRQIESRVSIGAGLYPRHARSIEELIKCADIALYEAKTRGRGRACTFEPALLASWQKQATMLQSARDALSAGQITPFYQPKVDLSARRIVGFEALLRCVRPDGSIMMPAEIAAAFEHPELAQVITARMSDAIANDISGWLAKGIDVGHVAINLSGADLRDEAFPTQMMARFSDRGIPLRCIEIEVTEQVFLGRKIGIVDKALRTFSAAGVRIALDDFGTGYASLSHLKQFPIDILKIDQRFVRELHTNPDDAAIVRAVLNLAYSLGLTTVAEGIETQEQADYLRAGGCLLGQGYLYSAAVPADAVPTLLAEQNTGDMPGSLHNRFATSR